MKRTIKTLLKEYRNKNIKKNFHKRNNDHFLNLLKIVEKEKGKTDAKNIKLCKEYSIDVFGSDDYAPCLYLYSAISSKFQEGWIPENYYLDTIVPKIQGSYGEVTKLKPLSRILFQTDFFPDLGNYTNNMFTDINFNYIPNNKLKEFLFNTTDKVIFKPDFSKRGAGIKIYTRDSFSTETLNSLRNGVFQKFIVQHPFFNELMPNSVATLRLTTIINKIGEVELRGAWLRVGMKNDKHVSASSGIRIPVDQNNGKLSDLGYYPNWQSTKIHPDTNVEFKDKIIPNFIQCKNLVLELHLKFPYTKCMGWDVIVNDQGRVEIIECNGHYNAIAMAEATQGPCYADLGWEKMWME